MQDVFDELMRFAGEVSLNEKPYDELDPSTLLEMPHAKLYLLRQPVIDHDAIKAVIAEHVYKGAFVNLNPLDGSSHDYPRLGSWIGDQRAALSFMGALTLAGMVKLVTPAGAPQEVKQRIKAGEVTIRAKPEHIMPWPKQGGGHEPDIQPPI